MTLSLSNGQVERQNAPDVSPGMNPVPNPSREDVTLTFVPKLERGVCSELPRREAPQSHGRKSVVRGLLHGRFERFKRFHSGLGMDLL